MLGRLFIALATLLLAGGCASAVYDSLESRGVTAGDVARERALETGDAARRTKNAAARAVEALDAVDSASGPALARAINDVAAAEDSLLRESRFLRQRINNWRAASERDLADKRAALGYYSGEERVRAEQEFDTAGARQTRQIAAFSRADRDVSNALNLLQHERELLRNTPNAAAAGSRREGRADLIAEIEAAIASLEAAEAEATR